MPSMKRKLNKISGGKESSTTRYKKHKRNFIFTTKTKKEVLLRQGRFCSNYPNSPLSKLLGNHCDTYNNFDRKCMFLPGTEQYDHFIRRELSKNDSVDNCNILCCSCHSLKTKMVYFNKFKTLDEAKNYIIDYMYFYNNERIHSGINYLTPVLCEQQAA